jgi:hypothetical protein
MARSTEAAMTTLNKRLTPFSAPSGQSENLESCSGRNVI